MRNTLMLCLVVYCLGAAATLEPAAEFVHQDAAGKFSILGQAAVVITGDDQLVSHIMEDVFAVNLLSQGVRVVYPEETVLGKLRAPADPMQIARKVGANVLITGMALTEPVCTEHKGECVSKRSAKISLASLSLVDVPQGKTLVWTLYEPQGTATVSQVARAFVSRVMKALR